VIEIALGAAEIAMLAATAVGSGFVVYALHRFAVETEKDRADGLERSLSRAKATLVDEHRRAVQAEKKAEKVNGLSNKLSISEAEVEALALQNDSLEREVNTYAFTLAEQLDDFGMNDVTEEWLPSLAEFTEERLARRLLERITLAQVFDAVEYARGPVAPYAKAFGIGPFANDRTPLSQLPAAVADEIYAPLHGQLRHVSTIEQERLNGGDKSLTQELDFLEQVDIKALALANIAAQDRIRQRREGAK